VNFSQSHDALALCTHHNANAVGGCTEMIRRDRHSPTVATTEPLVHILLDLDADRVFTGFASGFVRRQTNVRPSPWHVAAATCQNGGLTCSHSPFSACDAQQPGVRCGGAYSELGDRRQQLINNWVARFSKATGQQVEAGQRSRRSRTHS